MAKTHCFFKVSAVAIGLGLSMNAFAAGFQINELSPTIQATALADAATAVGDVTGQAYNPATLATVPGTQLYIGGSVIIPDVDFNNAHGSISNYTLASSTNRQTITVNGVSSGGDISPTAAVPAIYGSTHLNEISPNLVAGFGINTQWGLSTDYPGDWAGMFNSVDSTIKTIDFTPDIAYQIAPWISIGAGINVQYFTATLSNDTFQQTSTDIGSGVIPNTGNAVAYNSLSGSSWGVGYDVGILLTPRQGTNIGISYRSPVTQKVNGNIEGDIVAAGINDLPSPYPPNLSNPVPISGTGNTTIKLPAVVDIGLSQAVTDKLTLMANAQYTDWSSIGSLNINAVTSSPAFVAEGIPVAAQTQSLTENNILNWKGSWLYSLGGSYVLTPQWTLMAGVAYDQTPTNNTDRDARIPDTNREWISGGFQYAATQNFSIDGTFTHIFMNNQSINNVSTPIAGQSTYTTSANYTGYADIVALGLNYKFE